MSLLLTWNVQCFFVNFEHAIAGWDKNTDQIVEAYKKKFRPLLFSSSEELERFF